MFFLIFHSILFKKIFIINNIKKIVISDGSFYILLHYNIINYICRASMMNAVEAAVRKSNELTSNIK